MSWFNRAPKVAVPSNAKLGEFEVSSEILQKLARDLQNTAGDKETRGLTPEQFLGLKIHNALFGLIVSVTKQMPGMSDKWQDSRYYTQARAIIDPMIAQANGIDLAEVQKTEPLDRFARRT